MVTWWYSTNSITLFTLTFWKYIIKHYDFEMSQNKVRIRRVGQRTNNILPITLLRIKNNPSSFLFPVCPYCDCKINSLPKESPTPNTIPLNHPHPHHQDKNSKINRNENTANDDDGRPNSNTNCKNIHSDTNNIEKITLSSHNDKEESLSQCLAKLSIQNKKSSIIMNQIPPTSPSHHLNLVNSSHSKNTNLSISMYICNKCKTILSSNDIEWKFRLSFSALFNENLLHGKIIIISTLLYLIYYHTYFILFFLNFLKKMLKIILKNHCTHFCFFLFIFSVFFF